MIFRRNLKSSSSLTRNGAINFHRPTRHPVCASLTTETSLAQHLMEQLRDTSLNGEQQGIAELLIGNIDDYGYLMATIDELGATTNLPGEKILEVLKVIQSFDPPGIGARDLRECLMLQLERAGQQNMLEYC